MRGCEQQDVNDSTGSEAITMRQGSAMKQATAAIINLAEQSWILHRSYGTFTVSGRRAGEPYAVTRVAGRTAVMDLGDKRTLDVPITAEEVAADLCREINADGGDESFF